MNLPRPRRLMAGTALLAGALSLGACSSTQIAQVDAAISQAQALTQNLCQFVPTVATVSGVIAALFPGGAAVSTIAAGVASDICSAVAAAPVVVPKTASLARRATGPTPRPSLPLVDPATGVTIRGNFTQ